jgi:hypothetical protein
MYKNISVINSTKWELSSKLLSDNYSIKKNTLSLRHEISSPAQTLGSWIPVHSRHWCLSAFLRNYVVLCRYRPFDRADHPSKESYQLSIRFIVSD